MPSLPSPHQPNSGSTMTSSASGTIHHGPYLENSYSVTLTPTLPDTLTIINSPLAVLYHVNGLMNSLPILEIIISLHYCPESFKLPLHNHHIPIPCTNHYISIPCIFIPHKPTPQSFYNHSHHHHHIIIPLT